jgi:hypothetical protein
VATIRVRGGTTVERSDAELASRPLPALNVRGQTMVQALQTLAQPAGLRAVIEDGAIVLRTRSGTRRRVGPSMKRLICDSNAAVRLCTVSPLPPS